MTPEYNDIFVSLNESKKDIDELIEICENSKVKLTLFLKSSLILYMYNVIEGVFSRVNTEIFDYINYNDIPIENLPNPIQKIYLKFHKKNIHDLDSLMSFYQNKNLTRAKFSEISERITLFSGNLDAKKIRDFSKKQIGISHIHTKQGTKLLTVKNLRNKLAHGELNFQEATRDIDIKNFKSIIADCFEFMQTVVEEYDKYFSENIMVVSEEQRM